MCFEDPTGARLRVFPRLEVAFDAYRQALQALVQGPDLRRVDLDLCVVEVVAASLVIGRSRVSLEYAS